MHSSPFALKLVLRILLLTLNVLALAFATVTARFTLSLVLALLAIVVVIELYRFVSQSNRNMARFLASIRYDDYSRSFRSATDEGAGDAHHAVLSQAFANTMELFKKEREQQEAHTLHLTAMLDHLPVPLLSLSEDGLVELKNNAARRLFGNVAVSSIEDLQVFGQDFARAVSTIKPGVQSLLPFNCDGVERQLSCLATQIVSAQHAVTLISLQDIQRELDSVQLQAWQDLVGVLTHEIMNSITPVASLAKTTTTLVEDVQQQVEAQAERENILAELHDVSRAAGAVARRSDGLVKFVQRYRSLSVVPTPDKQMLCVRALFEQLQQLFTEKHKASHLAIVIDVQPDTLELYADSHLLEQILVNLIKNAIQACEANLAAQEAAEITLSARLSQRGHVLIEVTDNGPGVPAKIAGEIFMPFFTTKKDGSGVGLALTRQIMMAHGGSINLANAPQGGARFSLLFG